MREYFVHDAIRLFGISVPGLYTYRYMLFYGPLIGEQNKVFWPPMDFIVLDTLYLDHGNGD